MEERAQAKSKKSPAKQMQGICGAPQNTQFCSGALLREQRAQVSFEYLLTAVFAIMLAISAAIVIESMRGLALQAQADILSTRAKVIENIFAN